MLPRKHRIVVKQGIAEVKQKGRTVYGRHLTGIILKRRTGSGLRFAFVISSRVSKKAVERNRLKRDLSAFIRKSVGSLKSNADLLIIAKHSALAQSRETLNNDLLSIFEKGLK